YYPQNGTWVIDRASWCPGDLVHQYSHILTGVTANSNYSINVAFPPYTSVPSSSGSTAMYKIQNVIVYYGATNHTLDASIDDIIAPTNEESHYRENPFVGKPKIVVRNSGSTSITSIKFEYGVAGSTPQQYTWNGNIPSLNNQTIELAECTSLKTATGTNNKFEVKILEVNSQTNDGDATNNSLSSYFDAVPVWPATLRIQMKTNAQVANGVSENNWKIIDVDGNIVAQRINNTPNTTYLDTVRLGTSTYKLVVDDAGCDGMSWWMFQYYNPNPGAANIIVRGKTGIAQLPIKGYFNGDFGCGVTQYFKTDPLTSINDVEGTSKNMELYPNPATETVTLILNGLTTVSGIIEIKDAIGKTIYSERTSTASLTIDVSKFTQGMYFVSYEADKMDSILQQKLIIVR
ncbi:MAG TPA: T9SS type A sorting domain-containing protein, partial [Flavipsychrobacter sp.]|nr:T9SS type A sorting domain-containing protein [Flavipsychrobacter sp.]